MMNNQSNAGRSTPRDILATIDQFQRGKLRFSGFLDRTWSQIHDLPASAAVDPIALEDVWTELEIIYAQASAAGQLQLDEEQQQQVTHAIGELASLLTVPE